MKIFEYGLISVLAIALSGCQKTVEGAKDDLRDNSINASVALKDGIDNGANIAKNSASEAKKASENLSVAAALTPRIKNAINAEPSLNNDKNLIDVDSTKTEVRLIGHVASPELKALAAKIAQAELTKVKADQKLANNLVVTKPLN